MQVVLKSAAAWCCNWAAAAMVEALNCNWQAVRRNSLTAAGMVGVRLLESF